MAQEHAYITIYPANGMIYTCLSVQEGEFVVALKMIIDYLAQAPLAP
jgi:hypothetical protein